MDNESEKEGKKNGLTGDGDYMKEYTNGRWPVGSTWREHYYRNEKMQNIQKQKRRSKPANDQLIRSSQARSWEYKLIKVTTIILELVR